MGQKGKIEYTSRKGTGRKIDENRLNLIIWQNSVINHPNFSAVCFPFRQSNKNKNNRHVCLCGETRWRPHITKIHLKQRILIHYNCIGKHLKEEAFFWFIYNSYHICIQHINMMEEIWKWKCLNWNRLQKMWSDMNDW